jgi:hypothetical protein
MIFTKESKLSLGRVAFMLTFFMALWIWKQPGMDVQTYHFLFLLALLVYILTGKPDVFNKIVDAVIGLFSSKKI